jgi:hypothetical protein
MHQVLIFVLNNNFYIFFFSHGDFENFKGQTRGKQRHVGRDVQKNVEEDVRRNDIILLQEDPSQLQCPFEAQSIQQLQIITQKFYNIAIKIQIV